MHDGLALPKLHVQNRSRERDASLRCARLFSFGLPWYAAVAITCAFMALLVGIVVGFQIPNPNVILLAGLVVCATLFGYPGGISAAIITIAYSLYFFSDGHSFVSFSGESLQKMIVLLFGVFAITFFVCSLKRDEARAFAELERAARMLQEDNILLEEASTTDALTGLRNRLSLRRDYPEYSSSNEDLLVMMVDLDNFKIINDTYGHEAGDYVLGKMGESLSTLFGGHAYRYGGDEFLVIAPNQDIDALSVKTSELSRRIAGLTLENNDLGVNFSAGYVYGKPLLSNDLRQMMHQSDEKLYEAKSAGKNKVLGGAYRRSA